MIFKITVNWTVFLFFSAAESGYKEMKLNQYFFHIEFNSAQQGLDEARNQEAKEPRVNMRKKSSGSA